MEYYRKNHTVFMKHHSAIWKLEGFNWVIASEDDTEKMVPIDEKEAEFLTDCELRQHINYFISANALARTKHKGQVDKAGKDYFDAHIAEVVKLVPNEPYLKEIAYLHDILEDTDVTEESLRKEFPDEIVDAVVTMTHRKNESYQDYIERIKTNKRAVKVKICDLMQNMDLSRLETVTEKDLERFEKYSHALAELAKTL